MTLEMKGHDDIPDPDLYFTKADLVGVVPHVKDPVLISIVMVGRKVHRAVIDQGSSADVLFWSTFVNLRLSPDQLRLRDRSLIGLAGDQVECRGYIEQRNTFSDEEATRTIVITYVVVNTPSAYNLLFWKTLIKQVRSSSVPKNMKMKLPPLEGRVITIQSNQKDAQKCYESSLKSRRSYKAAAISQGAKVAEVFRNRAQPSTSTRTNWRRPRKGDRRKIIQTQCLYGARAAILDSRGDS